MALLYCDSFDHWNANNDATKYPDAYGFNLGYGDFDGYKVGADYGRNSQGLRIASWGAYYDVFTNLYRFTGLGGSRSQWGFGFAFKLQGNPLRTAIPLLAFVDSATIYSWLGNFYGTQMALCLSRAQTIQVRTGEPEGTLILNTSKVLRRNTWYYIEGSFTIGAGGSATIYVDGEQLGTFSGDTRGLGSSSADGFRIGFSKMERTLGDLPFKYACFDDFYITDGNVLSDLNVKALRPIADGSLNSWTPDTGSTRYTQVDDDTIDNDSSYIFAPTNGLEQTFTFQDISALTNVIIPGVQIAGAGRAGFGSPNVAAAGIVRSGGVTYPATAQALGTPFNSVSYYNSGWSYDHRTEIFPFSTNPATGGTWTPATISSSEFGVRRTT
jgi:hypothetical protein